jgi:hypothetical protein
LTAALAEKSKVVRFPWSGYYSLGPQIAGIAVASDGTLYDTETEGSDKQPAFLFHPFLTLFK